MTGPHPPPPPQLPGTPGLEQPPAHSRALSQQACDLETGAAGGGPHGKPLSSQHLPQPPSTDVSSSPQNLSSCHASQAKLLDAASSERSTLAPHREAGGLAAGSGGGPSAAMSTIGSSGPLVGCRWLLQRCSSMCPPCPGQAYGGNAAAGAGASTRSGSASVAPLFSVQSQLPSAPPLVRSRVEPKTFFAAERTFLAWMNIAVLVMFASLSLISSMASFRQRMVSERGLTETAVSTPKGCGDNAMCKASMVAGMALAPVSMCLMVYALYMYRLRSLRVLRRETVRYDDQRGPIVLTLLLITVVAVAYAMQLQSAL